MATTCGSRERTAMKTKRILSLIGLTLLALSPITWAAGHGGGGGGFGGGGRGGGFGGGFRGGGRSSGIAFGLPAGRFGGGNPHFSAGGPRFVGGMGVSRTRPRVFSGPSRGINRSAGSSLTRNRFFVFDDGFWFGLDAGFYPWDYLPYYADDYYPYDYYADDQPYDNTEASNNGVPVADPTVEAIQERLAQLGYYTGPVDGIFGPTTRDAVANYQVANQLNVTGSLSPDTMQSLGLPEPAAS